MFLSIFGLELTLTKAIVLADSIVSEEKESIGFKITDSDFAQVLDVLSIMG